MFFLSPSRQMSQRMKSVTCRCSLTDRLLSGFGAHEYHATSLAAQTALPAQQAHKPEQQTFIDEAIYS